MNPDDSILIGSIVSLFASLYLFFAFIQYFKYKYKHYYGISLFLGIFYPIGCIVPMYQTLDLSKDMHYIYTWVICEFATISHLPLFTIITELGVHGFGYLVITFWGANGLMLPLKLCGYEQTYLTSFIIACNIGVIGILASKFIIRYYDRTVDSSGNIVSTLSEPIEIIPHLIIPVNPVVYESPPEYQTDLDSSVESVLSNPPQYEIPNNENIPPEYEN